MGQVREVGRQLNGRQRPSSCSEAAEVINAATAAAAAAAATAKAAA